MLDARSVGGCLVLVQCKLFRNFRSRVLPGTAARTQRGHVAEWLRSGLQIRVPRFNSGRGLQTHFPEIP